MIVNTTLLRLKNLFYKCINMSKISYTVKTILKKKNWMLLTKTSTVLVLENFINFSI